MVVWRGFLKRSVPSDFPLESLVAIDMRNSHLEQVWNGYRLLRSLKILNLSHSHALISTPNFSSLPELERLILKDCESLVEVHESIGKLETKLIVLNLRDCRNLRNLPRSICMLKVLETLVISGCSNLEELPQEMWKMESLKVFDADRIEMSQSAPTTSWHALVSTFVSRPRKCPKLSWDSLPHSLVRLSLSDCNLYDYSFPMDFSNLPLLKELNLSRNPICSLPDFIRGLTSLNNLNISFCTRLQQLIDLPRLEKLWAFDCTSLEKISFQSNVSKAPANFLFQCEKLVEMEGCFRLETIGNLDNEVMKSLGMYQYDMHALNNLEVKMRNRWTCTDSEGPIQVLFETGIVNIFLPGDKVPECFSNKSVGSSISITIPSPPSSNTRIQGLNLCMVYATDGHWYEASTLLLTTMHNKTKDLRLIYYPICYGLSKTDEDMTWSSHWKFRQSELDVGDQLNVSVYRKPHIHVKEIGVRLVYDEKAHSSEDFVPVKASYCEGTSRIIKLGHLGWRS